MRDKAPLSHLLVAMQFAAIVLIAWPFFDQPPGQLPWLAISALGGLVGLYTLSHNKLGKWQVRAPSYIAAILLAATFLALLPLPGYRVITPDLRGFGSSPGGDDEPDLAHMAEDVRALIDRWLEEGHPITKPPILFTKFEDEVIDAEKARLAELRPGS